VTVYNDRNPDANEASIRETIVAIGGCFVIMGKHAGFDLVVCFPRTGTHIVEVKNPERKWKLTPAEIRAKKTIEASGCSYNIVATDDDVMRLAGLYGI
jgi:hypothetical protein